MNQQLREVASGGANHGELFGRNTLESKFCNGLRERARKSRSLCDRRKVAQGLRCLRGVYDTSGKRLDAETADGGEGPLSHRLGGEIRCELRESERVDALAALWKSCEQEFVRGGTSWRQDDDFRIARLSGEKGRGALQKFGIGTRPDQRPGVHEPLRPADSRSSR